MIKYWKVYILAIFILACQGPENYKFDPESTQDERSQDDSTDDSTENESTENESTDDSTDDSTENESTDDSTDDSTENESTDESTDDSTENESSEDESSEDESTGELILEDGFESGSYDYTVSGNSPLVVQSSNAKEGMYILKSQLTPDSDDPERTEVSLRDLKYNFDIDSEYWIGISIKLDTDFNEGDFNDQGMLMQWHYYNWRRPEVRDAQPFVLRYKSEGEIHVECEVLSNRKLASTTPSIGEWVDWVIHFKLSDTEGIFQVWKNGEQILDWTGDNHQVEHFDGAYLKIGLYSSQYDPNSTWQQVDMPEGITRTVYHDEFRIAGSNGSYDLVAPR